MRKVYKLEYTLWSNYVDTYSYIYAVDTYS